MPVILKIFFVGLIAFVPNPEDNEQTVLLLDAREGYAASDGTWIESHRPLLLARAGDCAGACRTDAQEVADFLYHSRLQPGSAGTLEWLDQSIHQGGAWALDDSLLSIQSDRRHSLEIQRSPRSRNRQPVPADRNQVADFDWVAKMGEIYPSAEAVDPDVLADEPRKDLIVARLELTEGSIKTRNLIHLADKVRPFEFKALRHKAAAPSYSQALAHWVVAEIPLPGCDVTITDKDFRTGEERTMKLSASDCDGGVIEMALLNIPESITEPPEDLEGHGGTGHHFEMYYELSNMRPPNKLRLVPQAVDGGVEIARAMLEQPDQSSDFLDSITAMPKGLTSWPVCPPVEF